MSNIINNIYSKLPTMSQSDQKIARQILRNPEQIVDCTISELANLAQVSGASVTRFCHNLGLTGFHNLKIQIAQASSNEKSQSLKDIANDDLQIALKQIDKNKIAEIRATLENIDSKTLEDVLNLLVKSRVVQVSAEGDTYPVAADAVYKMNQIGILAMASGGNVETAIAQSMNLGQDDCLLVISNSGESAALLNQIKVAKNQGIKIVAITNRADSPIALEADYHLQTAVRQTVLQSQYYFSRVAAFTMIEAIFLILISKDDDRVEHIKKHEEYISSQKI
ncbi:MurR/RpiR family transcriptional regulator [Lactobacillus acidophilus]|uniref:MurR/RpiR family transcriptional regulator n=1 Tax=Lactobacillus acidophilus TaxID=1579 RepID=UPI000F75EC89|nr:MurR/RpiR family transcriptional regulator [Lactobacillus acidophilus]AZN76534.1 RpiR family transcriptional regulator [Lactobacillus acidophilus]MCT3602631.1 MurR/RpiR family transcriptional regulator [Lactobacillus acidophilus]MCT3623821.1 MurR/RpiR family transcriptional regulator [Lactobacillus acidophilus]